MAWNRFLLFPPGFSAAWKGTHWSPQDKEDPWNTLKLGWTLRTSSIVLLHHAFVLRSKSQKYSLLIRSEISHHRLKHLTKLLSFSKGDLSSVCNYKLPMLQITPEDGHKSPMNCKKPQALSVQAFRQDKSRLFSPVRGAALIYITGRSAPLCATSLKGEIDCVFLVLYPHLNSAVKNTFLDYV